MSPPTEPKDRTSITDKPGFFKNLVDGMRVGVIVSDYEGYIVYINDTYGRFIGMDQEMLIGRHASELPFNSRLHIVARTGQMEINWPHQFGDRALLVHRIPIREAGRIVAVLGLVLFDSASTASRLAEKVSCLQSKLRVFENELITLRSTRYTMDSMIGVSASLETLKKHALKAAASSLPVVITGESGTGKELLAQAVHHASSRRAFPLVRVNCAAIPKELFESELFGYAKGAFTGALSTGKPGKFELAHNGSVFLDEIGDLPLEMQPKLLRVIEEKEFERIGGTKPVIADFRLLAATNRDLEQMLAENSFREDLFYRLNVIALRIPPLRERPEDVVPIARHMLKQIASDRGLPSIELDPRAEEALTNYDWPGNARELHNLLERLVFFQDKSTISVHDLPPHLLKKPEEVVTAKASLLKHVQDATEKETIRNALIATHYNKSRAAALLGIHRSLLYKKIQKYDLPLQPEPEPA